MAATILNSPKTVEMSVFIVRAFVQLREMLTTNNQSAALDVLGARGYQAARAGIDWGAYQILPNSAVVGGFAANCRAGATSQVVAMPGTLAIFEVNVECSSTAHSEAADAVTVYELTSRATQGDVATPNYVERQISVTIAQ